MRSAYRRIPVFALALIAFLAAPRHAEATSCPAIGPVAANAKIDVVYDPVDSTMKACVAGTWLTMSGGGGGGGNLDGLTDVVITTPSTNQALVYNGAAWVNATLSLTETDPKVGALTGSKWCAANVGGTAIVCNQDAPAAGASSSGAAGYVQLSDGAGGFTTSGATAGEELFWNNTSKRLGIGTAFPVQTLQLGTASVGQENYLAIGDANSQRLKIGYGHGTGIVDNSFSAQIIADGTGNLVLSSRTSNASGLQFYTNAGTDGVERMRISGSGNVGIGTSVPDASALLDVSSTTKGFLPPRMTTSEVTAVATPADGLIVYDTDTDTIKLRANGAWVSLQAGGGAESDPQVGTLTGTKWCAANAGGTAIDCTADLPVAGAAGSASEIQFRNSGTGAFAANANFVWDDTNTRLGIGTSSPGLAAGAGRSYLSVKGVSEGAIVELIQAGADADAATIGGVQFATDNNTNGANGKRSAAIFSRQSGATANDRGGNLQFWTKADAGILNLAMTITDAANVGIGSATPQARLDVTGGARVGADAVCTVAKAGMLAWNSNTLQVCTDAGTFTSIANSSGGSSQWSNGASGAIYYSGNVGIGTTSPAAKLHIKDGALRTEDANGSWDFWGGQNLHLLEDGDSVNKTRLFIQGTSGNVGIGTIGPTSKLHVDGTGTLLQLTSSGFGSLYAGTDVNYPWFGTPAAHDLRLVTNGTERMRITAGGNIGIGTSNPAKQLSIWNASGSKAINLGTYAANYNGIWLGGTSGGTDYTFLQQFDTPNVFINRPSGAGIYFRENNSDQMMIASGGNVGIGTTSPTRARLEVAGVVSATNAIFGSDGQGVSMISSWPGIGFNAYYNGGDRAISTGYGGVWYMDPGTGNLGWRVSTASGAANAALTSTTLFSILQTGNVGIGTASPGAKLDVSGNILMSAAGPTITFNSGGPAISVPAANTLTLSTSGLERVRIDNNGNVGVGTTTPKSRLDIADGSGNGALTLGREGGFIGYNTYYNGGWKYKVNGYGGIIRLDTTGMQFHGAPNNVSGNDAAMTARLNMLIAPGGNLTVYGATTTCTLGNGSGATNCTSDGRLKDRIEPLESALDKLSQVNPVTFHWKDKTKDQREFLGLIAQEVEKVYPQAVSEVSDITIGTAKTLDYAVMVVPAIAAIKELKAANDNLRTENEQLRGALDEIRERLDKLEYGK